MNGARSVDPEEVTAARYSGVLQHELAVLTVTQVEDALSGTHVLHDDIVELDTPHLEDIGRIGGIDNTLGIAVDHAF